MTILVWNFFANEQYTYFMKGACTEQPWKGHARNNFDCKEEKQ